MQSLLEKAINELKGQLIQIEAAQLAGLSHQGGMAFILLTLPG